MLRSAGRWLAFIVVVAVSIGAAVAAYDLAGRAWNGVVEYRSPYAAIELPAAGAGPASVDRVVLVIVDGLREDASRTMSSLESLRGYGADLVLTTPQPSLSYPDWTTILSGAEHDVHGVVTNWHEGAAPVETVLDTAERAGVPFVVVGPSDIATLYPTAGRAEGSFFLEWDEKYLSDRYVSETLALVEAHDPRLVLLHLPDVDEAGHGFGGASTEYATAVARVDSDLRRLVEGLQDSRTAFVVVSDHGHLDTGGHGGWESVVTRVPAVMSGAGVRAGTGSHRLTDIAPTVAILAGIPVPRHATGEPLESVLSSAAPSALSAAYGQRLAATVVFARVVREPVGPVAESVWPKGSHGETVTAHLERAREDRLAFDRRSRLRGTAPWIALAAVMALLLPVIVSWRAAVAALVGAVAYHAVYNALFFVVHGDRWSLSSFNSEDLIDAWMNTRMIEAAVAGLLAAAVAAWVYPLLRRASRGPRGSDLAGRLTLGPLAVLFAQATLALQVAWFVWAWGVEPVWGMPDLKWGFKFDLDLIQSTALAGAVVLAPFVSYLVGRYHPRIRRADSVDRRIE